MFFPALDHVYGVAKITLQLWQVCWPSGGELVYQSQGSGFNLNLPVDRSSRETSSIVVKLIFAAFISSKVF